ncbi:hypothetical protein HBH70_074520 [Parastagonospora nodorum]|nr:hypothetical protein HBH53_184820 [Parastagonospora nodorum]KAH3997367.1 hypothetical protein HBI10_144040 [Parastagonospora nodorum]KAH4021159.1 hypothetical protein HBI13_112340 [Parastagonospora nodorum]KAH4037056.1 hypothetical protein HBI09_065330 [Parastagonospora nodorum]KAH4115850.1 hypothetical protein HBH47_175710 [Parastagonospora nodorum]
MPSSLSITASQENVLPDFQKERDITSKNQMTSPLLKLSSEIRNMIYTEAFRSSTTLVRSDKDKTDAKYLKYSEESESTAALVRVSRQVRYEALPLFYALTTFDLSVCDSTRAAEWTIGVENSAGITSIIRSNNTIFVDMLDEAESGHKCFPNVKHLQDAEIGMYEEALNDAEEQARNRM